MFSRNGYREAIIIKYMPYTRTIVQNFHLARMLEPEDAVSEGYVALINACDDYDKSKGMSLKSFIFIRIKWHLTNYIKDQKIKMRRGTDNVMINLPDTVSLNELYVDGMPYEPLDNKSLEPFDMIEKIISFNKGYKLLKYKTRGLMHRYYIEGATLMDIAKDTNVTRQAVWDRFQRAKVKIAQVL